MTDVLACVQKVQEHTDIRQRAFCYKRVLVNRFVILLDLNWLACKKKRTIHCIYQESLWRANLRPDVYRLLKIRYAETSTCNNTVGTLNCNVSDPWNLFKSYFVRPLLRNWPEISMMMSTKLSLQVSWIAFHRSPRLNWIRKVSSVAV